MATVVHHLNCGLLHVPPGPRASCHCLLLEDPAGLALVDCGIGLADCAEPQRRIGREAISAAGFQFLPELSAYRRIEALGLNPADVKHVVLTHADPDHVGGLADFPQAEVRLSTEEHASLAAGSTRYSPAQFEHAPRFVPHGPSDRKWFGLEARSLPLGFDSEVLLVPLFGHTTGHCGVAIQQGSKWFLHAGDAYYLRVELSTDDHPVSHLAASRADDDLARRASIAELRRLLRDHGDSLDLCGYHDLSEFPPDAPA